MEPTQTAGSAGSFQSVLPGIPCKTVLCWVGLSDEPDAAVRVAKALAKQGGGQCHVVMCLDSPFSSQGAPRRRRSPSQAPLTPEVIGRAARKLAELYGAGVRTMVLPGHPVREVRRYARTNKADLIVMGQQALMVEQNYGARLADQAPCAVMILLHPRRAT